MLDITMKYDISTKLTPMLQQSFIITWNITLRKRENKQTCGD